MCENSTTTDPVALRREARRKKILENSANRLRLIEGVKSSVRESLSNTSPENVTISEDRNFSDISPKANSSSEVSSKVKLNPKFKEVLQDNKELKEISDYLLNNNLVENEEEENEVVSNETEFDELERTSKNSYLENVMRKKMHYILLAIIVHGFFYYDLGYLFYENIFCPFYTLKVLELLSKKVKADGMQPFMILFLASLPQALQKPTQILLTVLSALVSDVFLYIFTFIVGIKVLEVLQ